MTSDIFQHSDTAMVRPDVCLIDFANYPFIRRFAGHLNHRLSCAYLYNSGFQSPNEGQSPQVTWEHPITTGETFAKHKLAKRWFQERAWAREAATLLGELRPSLVIVTNAPLEVVRGIQRWCRVNDVRFVFWLQDVHSRAIAEALSQRKQSLLLRPAAWRYRRLEQRLLGASDQVWIITDDHRAVLKNFGIPSSKVHLFPNWSTIEDFPEDDADADIREQAWRAQQGLAGKRLLMYSGTLGMKHNPRLLADLAGAYADDPSVAVVVISGGPGAEWLREHATARELGNLHILPFVEYSMIATTLRSATILLAILEPAAASFSVPSKVLTYACAGRPVVVAMPTDNAAARLIRDVGFGTVTPPGNSAAFVDAVRYLLDRPQHAADAGRRGRAYAERHFPMPMIEMRFMAMVAGLVHG